MNRLTVAWFALALAAAPAFVATPAFAKESAARAPASERSNSEAPVTGVAPSRTPRVASRAPASRADAERYAAREAQSPRAKSYRGGEAVVVVGASTAVIILAVILLIILL